MPSDLLSLILVHQLHSLTQENFSQGLHAAWASREVLAGQFAVSKEEWEEGFRELFPSFKNQEKGSR